MWKTRSLYFKVTKLISPIHSSFALVPYLPFAQTFKNAEALVYSRHGSPLTLHEGDHGATKSICRATRNALSRHSSILLIHSSRQMNRYGSTSALCVESAHWLQPGEQLDTNMDSHFHSPINTPTFSEVESIKLLRKMCRFGSLQAVH